MESHLLPRICAYLIDVILISLVISLVTAWIPQSEKYKQALEKEEKIVEQVNKGELKLDDVYKEYLDINYTIDKERMIISLVTAVATLGYFATFAYYNDGKTIGKKLMHIKVASDNGEELTHNQMFLRTLLVQGVLTSIISMTLLTFIDSSQYVWVNTVQMIQSFIIIVTIFMVIFRKDKKGLHDILFKTKVISTK